MEIRKFSLNNDKHRLEFTNIGASLMKWETINRSGEFVDIVLGFNNPEHYMDNPAAFGAIVGRYANRIETGKFFLNDESYQLEQNNGIHHIHGGSKNFGTQIWELTTQKDQEISFSLESPHMEAGYPGNLSIQVKYILSADGELKILYTANSDRDTICNLTNHSYINLSGESSGEVYKDHHFQINASHFLPVDSESIPTGVYQSVENTIMDLRKSQKLQFDQFEKNLLFVHTKAYDHNFILGNEKMMRHATSVYSESTGITLDCYTNKPGLQFYLACFLEDIKSKTGSDYKPYHAFCLEAQHFPDSPNKHYFPSSILRANETYKQETIYKVYCD